MHHTWRVFLLLVYTGRISDNACSPSNEYPYEPRHLSDFVWDSRIGWVTVPAAPKLITAGPMVFQYQSSMVLVTLKGSRNALPRSNSLLKMTLLTLHSASSDTLLEAPSD
jgi:hypothetical protein